jgi:25S rRNA (cytosine2870-C5)-methyltransferase
MYHLPTATELEKDVDRVVPPTEVRSHIESILEVLAEFKARREEGRSRQEYIDVLIIYISELYGYLPELVEYFMTMFSPSECLEFIDASDKPRPLVIRTNTLKARRKDLAAALIKRGVSLDPLAGWSKVGLKIIESPVPIGATPEYLSGMYMLQSAASMCPVLALSPQPQEKVLDMSAAPGGKTSYIAQLMRNTGTIIANDLKSERQKATVANMHRLGVKNVITCANDGRKLGHMFKNRFDRILLDAPCSGLGVISRDPSVKVQRTIADIKQCAHLQKELLLAAIDALKYKSTTGGFMVYSTCSVSVYENEEVVQYGLQKRDIQIVETGLGFGSAGFTRYQQKRFHPSMALTKRFYPHTVNMDGFFVCKIKKLSDKRPVADNKDDAGMEATEHVTTSESNSTDSANRAGSKSGKLTSKDSQKRVTDVDELVNQKKARVSIVPKPRVLSAEKKKSNAKVTKPRRAKKSGATGDA